MDVGERDGWLQERYAQWLDACTKVAFVLSVASFLLYVSGALTPYVPLDRLPDFWNLPLEQYLERTQAPRGWGWLRFLGYGDYLNYLGICMFALVVLVCDLAVLPHLLRRGERLLAALALAQAAVLLGAASGLFAGG
jgi:hypothetical protein